MGLSEVQIPKVLGCLAFGVSVSLPPYYQKEEKYEEKDSVVELINRSLDNYMEMWNPIVNEFPNITLKLIPVLLEPVERINMNQLKDQLKMLGEGGMAWEDSKKIIINWSAVIGTLILVAAIWKFNRYRRKSVYGTLVSVQQLGRELPDSVHCPTKPTQDDEEVAVTSTNEAEVQSTPVENKPTPPVVQKK